MARCNNCGEVFKQMKVGQKYCRKEECFDFEIKRVLEKQQKTKEKAWKKRKSKIKEKLKTNSDYIQELQVIFNRYIRLRDKNKPCISCPNPLTGKYDAGHFYSVGSYPELRFNEDNVHGQCVHCNQHKHGNIHEYTERLPSRIGNTAFEELKNKKGTPLKLTIPEIKTLKEVYKHKIKEL